MLWDVWLLYGPIATSLSRWSSAAESKLFVRIIFLFFFIASVSKNFAHHTDAPYRASRLVAYTSPAPPWRLDLSLAFLSGDLAAGQVKHFAPAGKHRRFVGDRPAPTADRIRVFDLQE